MVPCELPAVTLLGPPGRAPRPAAAGRRVSGGAGLHVFGSCEHRSDFGHEVLSKDRHGVSVSSRGARGSVYGTGRVPALPTLACGRLPGSGTSRPRAPPPPLALWVPGPERPSVTDEVTQDVGTGPL